MDDGLIVYGCRLLIPTAMHREVLTSLHESHQGSVCTKERARLVVYWPGLDNDIDNVLSSCKQCQDHLPSNPRELIPFKPRPSRPFQELSVDFFCSHAGHNFLVMVNCFTDWPDIVHMGHDATPHLLSALKQVFCRSGSPNVIWSDQGPQFTSKVFNDFSRKWGFRHITSTATYPQSNGGGHLQVHEEDYSCSMDRCTAGHREVGPGPPPVSKHAITEGWTVTCTEALWAFHSGPCPGPPPCIRS